MAISPATQKTLWAAARGMCAFDGCTEKLYVGSYEPGRSHVIGEMAHIRGEKIGSNRHDPSQPATERDDFSNLILLCPTHHTVIDKKENENIYRVEVLEAMKRRHESILDNLLQGENFDSRQGLARFISGLLTENYVAFETYGPISDFARRHPHGDAHQIWLRERLATIVPNNRQILELLRRYNHLLNADERVVAARFVQHARSYECWVADEVSYDAVRRFPPEFATLMESIADAEAS